MTPSIDLFASSLNYKCKPYVAFRPDPEAQAINAFHISWVNMCVYEFPSFCIINQVLPKISEEKSTGVIVIPYWPTQVAIFNQYANQLPSYVALHSNNTDAAIRPSKDPSPTKDVTITDVPLIGGLLKSHGVSKEAASIIIQAWRPGTQKQYKCYLQKLEQYCCERSINPIYPNVGTAINFLHGFYKKGLSYSTLNTVRSALSNVVQPINNFTFGTHPLVTRYMQGYL